MNQIREKALSHIQDESFIHVFINGKYVKIHIDDEVKRLEAGRISPETFESKISRTLHVYFREMLPYENNQ